MKHIYIYGMGNYGHRLMTMIETYYSNTIKVIGLFDKNPCGQIIGIPFIDVNAADKTIPIVVSVYDSDVSREIFEYLQAVGFNSIWWFRYEKWSEHNDFFNEQCLPSNAWEQPFLPTVEMHIADGCNLKCRGCTHFSPIFGQELPDFNSRISDVEKLIDKGVFVGTFSILGGEPFLNPEIGRYAATIRELLPESRISIVSNGILILKCSDDTLRQISDNKVGIEISEYEPTHHLIGKIEGRLKEFNIRYKLRPYEEKLQFNKPLSLSKNSKFLKKCYSYGCVTLWNGRIARCPTLMYIDKFNEYFEKDLPNEGIYQIDSVQDAQELVDLMYECVPLCDHCVENVMPWSVCASKPVIDDFAAED